MEQSPPSIFEMCCKCETSQKCISFHAVKWGQRMCWSYILSPQCHRFYSKHPQKWTKRSEYLILCRSGDLMPDLITILIKWVLHRMTHDFPCVRWDNTIQVWYSSPSWENEKNKCWGHFQVRDKSWYVSLSATWSLMTAGWHFQCNCCDSALRTKKSLGTHMMKNHNGQQRSSNQQCNNVQAKHLENQCWNPAC